MFVLFVLFALAFSHVDVGIGMARRQVYSALNSMRSFRTEKTLVEEHTGSWNSSRGI